MFKIGDIVIFSEPSWSFNRVSVLVLDSYEGSTESFIFEGFKHELTELAQFRDCIAFVVPGSSLARRLLCK